MKMGEESNSKQPNPNTRRVPTPAECQPLGITAAHNRALDVKIQDLTLVIPPVGPTRRVIFPQRAGCRFRIDVLLR
jgi:hypothetical protein